MTVPHEPKVPSGPIPVFVEPILDLQKRARFWSRLALAAALLVVVTALALAYRGTLPWWIAVVAIILGWLPLAADTRVAEIRAKVNEQVRDQAISSMQAQAGADADDDA